MSGAFATRFVDRDLRLAYEASIRKIFRDADQARSFFADAHDGFYAHLARLGPRLAQHVEQARADGIDLRPFDAATPAVRWSDRLEAAALDPSAFPLPVDVVLPEAWPGGRLELAVTLGAPAPTARLAAWIEAVEATLRAAPLGSEAGHAPLDVSPLAVAHAGERLGLYVGTNAEVAPAARDAVAARLDAILAATRPGLEAIFADGRAEEELGGPLLPITEVVPAARLADPRDAFNPHGPLVDDAPGATLLRTRHDRGEVSVIALIAMREHDWGRVNLTLARWLAEHADDDHARAARRAGSGA